MLDLLTDPATWFVIGTILLVIELFDGSLVFFSSNRCSCIEYISFNLAFGDWCSFDTGVICGIVFVFFYTATRYYMHFQKKR